MTNEQELQELKQRITELEKKIKKEKDNGWYGENLENGGMYYTIDTETNCIIDLFELETEEDEECYNTANKFTNEEFAQRQMDIDTLRRRMQRFSDENGGQELDWSDNLTAKWCIEIRNEKIEVRIKIECWNICHNLFQVYFATKEIAWQAKKLFEDEILRLYS